MSGYSIQSAAAQTRPVNVAACMGFCANFSPWILPHIISPTLYQSPYAVSIPLSRMCREAAGLKWSGIMRTFGDNPAVLKTQTLHTWTEGKLFSSFSNMYIFQRFLAIFSKYFLLATNATNKSFCGTRRKVFSMPIISLPTVSVGFKFLLTNSRVFYGHCLWMELAQVLQISLRLPLFNAGKHLQKQ